MGMAGRGSSRYVVRASAGDRAMKLKPPEEALEQGRNLFSNSMYRLSLLIVDLSIDTMPRKHPRIKFDDDSSGWYITFFGLHWYTVFSCLCRWWVDTWSPPSSSSSGATTKEEGVPAVGRIVVWHQYSSATVRTTTDRRSAPAMGAPTGADSSAPTGAEHAQCAGAGADLHVRQSGIQRQFDRALARKLPALPTAEARRSRESTRLINGSSLSALAGRVGGAVRRVLYVECCVACWALCGMLSVVSCVVMCVPLLYEKTTITHIGQHWFRSNAYDHDPWFSWWKCVIFHIRRPRCSGWYSHSSKWSCDPRIEYCRGAMVLVNCRRSSRVNYFHWRWWMRCAQSTSKMISNGATTTDIHTFVVYDPMRIIRPAHAPIALWRTATTGGLCRRPWRGPSASFSTRPTPRATGADASATAMLDPRQWSPMLRTIVWPSPSCAPSSKTSGRGTLTGRSSTFVASRFFVVDILLANHGRTWSQSIEQKRPSFSRCSRSLVESFDGFVCFAQRSATTTTINGQRDYADITVTSAYCHINTTNSIDTTAADSDAVHTIRTTGRRWTIPTHRTTDSWLSQSTQPALSVSPDYGMDPARWSDTQLLCCGRHQSTIHSARLMIVDEQ